jgi:undecaprenyl-diphosphatase
MTLLPILILAVIQGITEFLPISSDGHLVVATALYARWSGEPLPKDLLEVEIMLHAGTLLAVIIMFWRQLLRLLTVDRRVIGLLAVGTAPVLASGLFMEQFLKGVLTSPLAAGLGLIVSGFLLIWARRHCQGGRDYPDLTYKDALWIGLFQAVSPLPGVSRSGTTIAAALAVGKLQPRAAADFSFLLSVPAIGAAVSYELLKLIRKGGASDVSWELLAIGAGVSFVVGLASLEFLLRWIRRGRLIDFAWWVIPLGIGVVVWQLVLLSGDAAARIGP